VREERKEQLAEEAVLCVARVAPVDLRPRRLDQLLVLHAGRAGGDAGHAAEALVDVVHEGVGHADLALGGQLHQRDAAARRIHLLAPQKVRRAGGEAEAAVHAIGDQLRIGRMMRVEGGEVCQRPGMLRLVMQGAPARRHPHTASLRASERSVLARGQHCRLHVCRHHRRQQLVG